jgi:hypothetical protein
VSLTRCSATVRRHPTDRSALSAAPMVFTGPASAPLGLS